MIAGGTLGGVLFLFGPRPKSAGSASIWRKYPALRRAVEGALVGLLVTAFVLIVPSFALIPEWARSSELGLFVLAAIAGFAGTPLLDLAARALFPALGTERAQGRPRNWSGNRGCVGKLGKPRRTRRGNCADRGVWR